MIEWLLDLDTLSLGGEDVRFAFDIQAPGWVWALVGAAAVGLGWWSYRKLIGPAWARIGLGTARALMLIAVVALVLGPKLVKRTEQVEKDWVVVLVDRSASLTIEDGGAVDGGDDRRTREAQVRDVLGAHMEQIDALSEDREVVWLGFDSGAYDLERGADGLELGEPVGRRTSLGAAIDQALARAAARPLSAVVVISDGRSVDEISRNAVRRLTSERVPVHALALGSAESAGDIAVRRVDAPGVAFAGDVTPVRVELERAGGDGGAAGAMVRLVDRATRRILDERRVEFGEGEDSASAALVSREDDAGEREWEVEVVAEGVDLIAGNNTKRVEIELVDRPMRVLYIDGGPRWEQRYLRNLLLREGSIESSALILALDRRYTQEGNIEIDALPDSLERWAEYDVVVLGDVSPEVFTYEQLAQLKEHVSVRGGGLLWIGGYGHTPVDWWGTPLADLLPMTRQSTDGDEVGEPVTVEPTEGAERLGVMRLGGETGEWPDELSDPATGWSRIDGLQRIDARGLKPTAEALAVGRGVFDGGAWPVVMTMRYGAGRSLYVATDETWRWRYGRGEVYFERFWVQMIRMLGRESLARSGVSAVVRVEPRRAVVDVATRVSVELLDQSLLELGLPSIGVELERRPEAGDEEGEAMRAMVTLRPEGESGRVYSAAWLAPAAGEWRASVSEPLLAGLGLEAEVEVVLPDDELRRPEADHALLASLSEQTGGRVLDESGFGALFTDPALLPKRRVVVWDETAEALWDTPLALLFVVILLSMEWSGRRLIRLI